MFNCIYKIIFDFQTLIVGITGFLGIIYTLRENACAIKEQHERAISHEKETLRVALIAELELIQKSLIGLSEKSSSGAFSQGAFYPDELSSVVYKSLISKVGLLDLEEVAAVIKAYTLVNDFSARLKILSVGHDPSFDRSGYIFILAEHEPKAIGICKSFAGSIVETINVLKKLKL